MKNGKLSYLMMLKILTLNFYLTKAMKIFKRLQPSSKFTPIKWNTTLLCVIYRVEISTVPRTFSKISELTKTKLFTRALRNSRTQLFPKHLQYKSKRSFQTKINFRSFYQPSTFISNRIKFKWNSNFVFHFQRFSLPRYFRSLTTDYWKLLASLQYKENL